MSAPCAERFGDRRGAEIGIREHDLVAHGRDVGAGVEMRERLAACLQFVDALRDRVAGDDRDLRLVALFLERARDRVACAMRIEPAGVHHELHAALGGERPQLEQHRHDVARIAGARVALAVLLQDREGEFGEVIRGDVLDAAAFDRGAHRPPGIAVKAEPGADTDRFHGANGRRAFGKKQMLGTLRHHAQAVHRPRRPRAIQ